MYGSTRRSMFTVALFTCGGARFSSMSSRCADVRLAGRPIAQTSTSTCCSVHMITLKQCYAEAILEAGSATLSALHQFYSYLREAVRIFQPSFVHATLCHMSDADRLTKSSPSRTRRCGSAAAEAAGGSSATVAEQTKQYH